MPATNQQNVLLGGIPANQNMAINARRSGHREINMAITYREFTSAYIEQIKQLYAEEEWNSYLKDDAKLIRAFDNSLYVLGAFDGEKLLGFIRCVGDGEHILLVQDLIVAKAYRRQKIGSALFQAIWDRYQQVRMFHVVTDLTDEMDNQFYQSFGMRPLAEEHMISYFR